MVGEEVPGMTKKVRRNEHGIYDVKYLSYVEVVISLIVGLKIPQIQLLQNQNHLFRP